MRRAVALLAALPLVASCGGEPDLPAVDLGLRVVPGAEEVQVGRGFPLTVVRTWAKDLVPSEGTERSLAPLVLRLEGTTRREDDRRVEETRQYRAYAFRRADVEVRAPTFTAAPKGGGPERRVTAAPFRVRVRPTVDPSSPGAPEMPGGPLDEPVAWGRWAVLTAAALAGLALAVRALGRRRGPSPPPRLVAPTPPGPTPAERTLDALRILRATPPGDGAAARAQVVATAGLVREYLADGLGIPAPRRTTEEVVEALRAAGAVAAAPAGRLRDVLGRADLVKFAAHEPSANECADVLDAAEAFVAAPSSGPARNPVP